MGVSLRLPEKKKGALRECKTGLPLWLCPAVRIRTCIVPCIIGRNCDRISLFISKRPEWRKGKK